MGKKIQKKGKEDKSNLTHKTKQKANKIKIADKIKEKANKIKIVNKIQKKKNTIYISYNLRIILCAISFIMCIGLSFLFLSKTLQVEEAKVVTYQEMGSLDYKVYLKDNDFYETPYLEKNMVYIASLIDNIYVDLNYRFIIDNVSDMSFSYDVVGNLVISSDQGKNKLYEKEYILKSSKIETRQDITIYNIQDSLSINYDYYNSLANSFKSTFGVDAESKLIIYIRVKKKVDNELYNVALNETKQMELTIPLTQRTLNIGINDTSINASNNIVSESSVKFGNIVCGVISAILFIGSVASILKTLELLFLLIPKKSKYDKYVGKILTEYDRLIVETPTEPRLENKEIIVIKRIEELLDARDNLKRPIMYYNLVSHQKCYFYIEKENTIYLLTIKAVDLEVKNENKK